MPTISMFFGILIRMFFLDIPKHHVPHIHVVLGVIGGQFAYFIFIWDRLDSARA